MLMPASLHIWVYTGSVDEPDGWFTAEIEVPGWPRPGDQITHVFDLVVESVHWCADDRSFEIHCESLKVSDEDLTRWIAEAPKLGLAWSG